MSSHDAQNVIPKDLPKIGKGTIIAVAVIVVILMVGLFIWRIIPLHQHEQDLSADASNSSTQAPMVDVTSPKSESSTVDLTLPGDAHPMKQAALYARVNGFLKKWYVDINDHVEQGQLLAEISAPDLDAQLEQARAAVDQANANAESAKVNNQLAQATLERYKGLLPGGAVTQQDFDTRQTTANQANAANDAAQAAVKSAAANVHQLEAEQGFEKIYAPFAGTITARNYDVGALISPTDVSPGHEIFDIAQTDKLRIYVKIPQGYAHLIHEKEEAFFEVRNFPGHEFPGFVARSAGVIDPATRTLYTEVDFDNSDGKLFAGMYGEIKFHLHVENPTLTIPTSALVYVADGTRVAIVQDSKVHFQPITLGQDFGTEIEVATGLQGNESVIANPGEKLAEGKAVRVSAPANASSPPPVPKEAARLAESNGVGENK